MTDDEKRQQKAMLLLEYQEAEDNLAHLLEQAKRKAAAFKEVAVWLDDVAVDVKSYDPRENRRFDANLRANFQLYTDMVNLNAALALVDEISKAEGKVIDLGKRKTALGLK